MALTVGTNSYISADNADVYFEDSIHASSWTSSTDEAKEQALVTATRMLDRQLWVGEKAGDPQTLQWPRSGVSDPYGDAISSVATPQFILDATCELALALIINTSLQDQANTFSNTKRLKAGSVEVEYFRPYFISGGRFPTIVQELVGFYLRGSNNLEFAYVSGSRDSDGNLIETAFDSTLYDKTGPV